MLKSLFMASHASTASLPRSAASESVQRQRLIACLLLVLATLAVYNPISRAPFLNFDDDYYILQNAHVRSGLNWNTVVWAFTTSEMSNWHPITWMSHALDVQLFGLNPTGHHYVNVLLHAFNAVLLFLFLYKMTGSMGRSFVVAALFAVHPINVEPVAWISERKNLISMLFFLLGMLAYARYVLKPGIVRYLPIVLCFALGLMAKPQVVAFPFLLLLLDYWPLKRIGAPGSPKLQTPKPKPRKPTPVEESADTFTAATRPLSALILEKVPLMILSAISCVITMKVQTVSLHAEYPLSIRVLNASLGYMRYIAKAIWPTNLALLYPYNGFEVDRTLAILSIIVLCLVTFLVIRARERRYLLVGWFWFVGTMIPMIGLVQVGVQAMADRYAYIPFIGLFIMITWGAADLSKNFNLPQGFAAAASAIVLAGLTFATWRQIGYWSDNVKLWEHTAQVTHNNFLAEDSIATALLAKGRTADAAQHFHAAVQINSQDPIGNLNLAAYEQGRGNSSAAMGYYDRVLQVTTNQHLLTGALAGRGFLFYSAKQYDEAKKSYEAALAQFPENPQALMGLGLVAQRAGNLRQAIDCYSRSAQLEPNDVVLLLFAQALESDGQTQPAQNVRAQAEHISRDLARASRLSQQLLTN